MESLLFLIRKIGRASTNPINKAINNGYCTLNPENSNIGIHPIFTLIAMYTGFKVIGVMGLLIGPIVLKNEAIRN